VGVCIVDSFKDVLLHSIFGVNGSLDLAGALENLLSRPPCDHGNVVFSEVVGCVRMLDFLLPYLLKPLQLLSCMLSDVGSPALPVVFNLASDFLEFLVGLGRLDNR
jgi:hypothetical protein